MIECLVATAERRLSDPRGGINGFTPSVLPPSLICRRTRIRCQPATSARHLQRSVRVRTGPRDTFTESRLTLWAWAMSAASFRIEDPIFEQDGVARSENVRYLRRKTRNLGELPEPSRHSRLPDRLRVCNRRPGHASPGFKNLCTFCVNTHSSSRVISARPSPAP
jgi:hypothetical protein